jgi:archaemetzincin
LAISEEKNIIVVTCGRFEKGTTQYMMQRIADTFHVQVNLKECDMDVTKFYDPARRQYNANLLIESLRSRAPVGYLKYMGLFRGDLFIPILTYIFGQATLNGQYALASMYRLRNELYGLAPDNDLMLERFGKVAIHELGHTFGLIHCNNPVCIMRSSTYVEDLDMKYMEFCQDCQDVLQSKRQ